jgi:hypothetical protein
MVNATASIRPQNIKALWIDDIGGDPTVAANGPTDTDRRKKGAVVGAPSLRFE